MNGLLRGLTILSIAFASQIIEAAPAAPADKRGCSDHPLVTRIPGYVLSNCENQDFGTHRFHTQEPGAPKILNPEGRLARLTYGHPGAGAPEHPSKIQLIRNYQNALKEVGGKVIFEDAAAGHTVVRLAKGGQESFVEVKHYTKSYTVVILEKGAMAQVVSATDLSAALESEGRMALYGITFDVNKAQLKPESEATLQSMSEVLKGAPELTVFIVGHTDSVGEHAANLTLSRARAEAVKLALTSRFGISAQRLFADGVGAMCPVATNGTEAGRELNRRVEMVKR